MSLTEIARFADLTEAQIAASRLRADGVSVLVQNEYWGTSNFLMSIAMGGFGLWTPTSDAEDARQIIAELRAATPEPEDDEPPSPRDEPGVGLARASAALFLSLIFGGGAGFLVAGRRSRGGLQGAMAAAAMALAAVLGLFGLLILVAWIGDWLWFWFG